MGLLIPIVIVITTLAVGWLLRRQFLEHTFLARYGIPGPKPDLIYGSVFFFDLIYLNSINLIL